MRYEASSSFCPTAVERMAAAPVLALGTQPAPGTAAHPPVLLIVDRIPRRRRGPGARIAAGDPRAMLPRPAHQRPGDRIRVEAPVAPQPDQHTDRPFPHHFEFSG